MPTQAEIVDRARRIASFEVAPDMIDWEGWTDGEWRECIGLACYEIQRQGTPRQRKSVRKALRLFRSWCTPIQLRCLKSSGYVYVSGSAGGIYRIHPYCGGTERVTRHGTRWFVLTRFCYHDPECELPHADVALAHLLLIRADEPEFILRANERPARDLWDAAYVRRMARYRYWRQLAEAAA